MFNVYAVREKPEGKDRFFVGSLETLDEAKHLANCYTCGNASYAYIKEIGGNTVFFIRAPDYDEQPLDQANPPRPIQALPEQ